MNFDFKKISSPVHSNYCRANFVFLLGSYYSMADTNISGMRIIKKFEILFTSFRGLQKNLERVKMRRFKS